MNFPVSKNVTDEDPIFLPCKKCGKISTMYIENMITGAKTPIDICNNCLVYSPMLGNCVPITTEQVTNLSLDELSKALQDNENTIIAQMSDKYITNS
jgi:hypothetical protein